MKNKKIEIIGISVYILFIFISFMLKFEPGVKIGTNFMGFTISMIKVLPCAFILIGLFEVWVKKETIEKYFGNASGYKGYIWAVLLSSTTVGGAYVAFPVGYSLYKKGANLSYVLTYIGSSALTRIPMTIFEASFIGIKFSIMRLIISLPLVILSSIIISKYFVKDVYNDNEEIL